MKAIVITQFGPPEVLQLREVETPAPARGEVRVRVRATAVNRADLLQRLGTYPAPPDSPADIPGLEFAGEVDVVGAGVADWKPGDRVFGLCGGGAYAEYVTVHGRALARIPERKRQGLRMAPSSYRLVLRRARPSPQPVYSSSPSYRCVARYSRVPSALIA